KSPEARAKCGAFWRGKKQSPEHRAKNAETSRPSSRSPVLCIPDQGCSIAHHETQGTEVLPELSALADEVGRPRGACEGARGHRRSSPGATRRGEEGFLDLVQAAVLRHRQAAQAGTAGGPAAAPH